MSNLRSQTNTTGSLRERPHIAHNTEHARYVNKFSMIVSYIKLYLSAFIGVLLLIIVAGDTFILLSSILYFAALGSQVTVWAVVALATNNSYW